MKERGQESIYGELARKQELFGGYKQLIAEGLDMERAPFESADIRAGIVRDIASAIFIVRRELEIPYPNVTLRDEWVNKTGQTAEEDMEGFTTDKNVHVLADAFLPIDKAYGRIRFSARYLKDIALRRIGTEYVNDRYINPPPLIETVAHEMFHLWQFEKNRVQVEKDTLCLAEPNPDYTQYNLTLTENQAVEYEKDWFAKHQNWNIFTKAA